jgi:hypothetical protein
MEEARASIDGGGGALARPGALQTGRGDQVARLQRGHPVVLEGHRSVAYSSRDAAHTSTISLGRLDATAGPHHHHHHR